jgi:hypothetical protein
LKFYLKPNFFKINLTNSRGNLIYTIGSRLSNNVYFCLNLFNFFILVLILLDKEPIYFINKIMSVYRIHSTSSTHTNKQSFVYSKMGELLNDFNIHSKKK